MKKISTVLLVMALLSAFSACGETNEKTDNTTAATTTIAMENDVSENGTAENTGSDYSFFNEANYTVEKEEPTVVDNYYSVRTSYTVKDKTERTLPDEITLGSVDIKLSSMKIGDLIKRGWSLVKGNMADSTVKSHQKTNTVASMTDGKKAMLYAANLTDGTIKFSECFISDVNICYDESEVYYDGLSEAADFKYADEITSTSSLEDIISVFGEPDQIYVDEDFIDGTLKSTEISVFYEGSNDVSVNFSFKNEGDSGKMSRVEVVYG